MEGKIGKFGRITSSGEQSSPSDGYPASCCFFSGQRVFCQRVASGLFPRRRQPRGHLRHAGRRTQPQWRIPCDGFRHGEERGTVQRPFPVFALSSREGRHSLSGGADGHQHNDDRVDPTLSRKMIARLQRASRSGHPILLVMHARTGHDQETSRRDRLA